jgi:Calx-beta domain
MGRAMSDRGRCLLRKTSTVMAVALCTTVVGGLPAGATTSSLAISDARTIEPLTGVRVARFVVTLTPASTSTVTVDFASLDGTAMAPGDYAATQGTLTFQPGQTKRAIGVQVKSDTLTEPVETFTVNLSNAVGASIADGSGLGSIRDPVQTFTSFTGAPLADVVIDPTSTWAYATNTSLNEVEVVNLKTHAAAAPIPVGSLPEGIDITADGSTLYVACKGGSTVWVVDIATGAHHTIVIPSGFSNDTPFSIAIANNDKAFVATTFSGSGFGANMWQIVLSTEQVTKRTDFYAGGATTEDTHLQASFDRSRIGVVAGDISSGPVFVYTAATDHFTSEKDLAAFVDYVTMDRDGSTLLVDPGTYVLDQTPTLLGTITGGGGGVGLLPDGTIGYRTNGTSIDVLDVERFLSVRSVPLNNGTSGRSELAVAPNGSVMVVLTSMGITTLTT